MPELRFCSWREKKAESSLLLKGALNICQSPGLPGAFRGVTVAVDNSLACYCCSVTDHADPGKRSILLKSPQSVPTQVEHLASDPRLPNLPVRIEVDEEKPGKWQQLVTSKVNQIEKPNSRTMTFSLYVYHRDALMNPNCPIGDQSVGRGGSA